MNQNKKFTLNKLELEIEGEMITHDTHVYAELTDRSCIDIGSGAYIERDTFYFFKGLEKISICGQIGI